MFSSPAASTSSSSLFSRACWPACHETCGCVPESASTRAGAVPEAGRKEKEGVYCPEDAFQLLLFTPFQSKLLGLF